MDIGHELRWYGRILPKSITELKIIIVSDLHYGHPNCSVRHFRRTIEYIKERDDTYCFLNGDLMEAALKTSKGDVHTQVVSPKHQRKWVIKELEPIKDKILGMTTGNHESRITDLTSDDPSEIIAEALGVPYRPEGMLFKLSFGDNNNHTKGKPFVFWSYITHGYGGARTKSAKAVKVERTATWLHADYYAMSHDHVVNVAPSVYLLPDNRGSIGEDGFLSGRVTAHREMLVKTNSYLRWGGYAEAGGFPPSDLCTPVIHLLTPNSKLWEQYPEKPKKAVKVSV